MRSRECFPVERMVTGDKWEWGDNGTVSFTLGLNRQLVQIPKLSGPCEWHFQSHPTVQQRKDTHG